MALRLNPARSWKLTSEGLGSPALQSDTRPASLPKARNRVQWRQSDVLGTACLYAAKFHTKTEVMGETDMEEIICKVIRTIILIKMLKKC